MRRCIQLAKSNLGTVAPNPMVGCVVVEAGEIIGEGYTSAYGGPHAEVNAIQSVQNKSRLQHATLYVSLEPCSHFGKTPPCADLIIKHNIPNVVVGVLDPHNKVAGKGIEKLKRAGCKVIVGLLKDECIFINRRFFTYHQKKRPYIILKWAQSQDGYLAPHPKLRSEEPEPYWITNEYSRQLVHQWRSQEQAILAGTTTVIDDDPGLNTRDWFGNSPTRILVDRELKIPSTSKALIKDGKAWILTEGENKKASNGLLYRTIDFKKAIGQQICQLLWEEKIISLIVEGGSKTLNTFIAEGLWDEARIFKGQTVFQEGLEAPIVSGKTIAQYQVGDDELKVLRRD